MTVPSTLYFLPITFIPLLTMQNIETGWFFSDLGEYRPMSDWGTYYNFSYEELPPLSTEIQFDGHFQWLSDKKAAPAADEAALLALIDQAKAAGITLPSAFLRFMGDRNLRGAIEAVSCTACFFEFTHGLIPIPESQGEYLIHFLSDQQYCLLWYLYIKDGKEAGILVSPDFYLANGTAEGGGWLANEKRFLFSGTDTERFLYRFWLENVLWFKVVEGDGELNELEKEYLAHYKKD